jgi:putative oxidoreductase
MKYIVLAGRILFSLIFIQAIITHLSESSVAYALSHNVPFASLSVPLSGFIALLGGLSIALGYKAKWGAWLIVLFLVPVTSLMHNFWMIPDPMTAMVQQVMFLKNLSMLGGALMITYFGSGPLSLDAVFKPGRKSE